MSLFDMFTGRWPAKPTAPPEFVDTVPTAAGNEEPTPTPVAAWPFPTTAEINASRAEQFEELAADRAELKAELKAIVIEAPSLGIHFYHAGTTTIAWRHHNPPHESGSVRNPRLIDIATSVCNPRDQFAKWMGSAYAAQALLDGRYITVKAGQGLEWHDKKVSDMVIIQESIELIGVALAT